MNRAALHDLLVNTLGLVPEPVANAVSCTYFYEEVQWHPLHTTRVLRVIFDVHGEAMRIQLCASSDNNNTVLVAQPFSAPLLVALVAQEVQIIGSTAERFSAAGRSIPPCLTNQRHVRELSSVPC